VSRGTQCRCDNTGVDHSLGSAPRGVAVRENVSSEGSLPFVEMRCITGSELKVFPPSFDLRLGGKQHVVKFQLPPVSPYCGVFDLNGPQDMMLGVTGFQRPFLFVTQTLVLPQTVDLFIIPLEVI